MAIKSKKVKISTRQRTKYRIRKRVVGTATRARLTIYRSGQHIHCQAIEDLSGKTIASASTLDKVVLGRISSICAELEKKGGESGATESANGQAAAASAALKFANDSASPKGMRAAFAVGYVIGERLKELKQSTVIFDRNGFLYHGRVKALAEGARLAGLQF